MSDSRDNNTTNDLKSPLLPNQHNQQLLINIITEGEGEGEGEGPDGPRVHQTTNGERERERESKDSRRPSPFDFLGPSAAEFSPPRLSSIDPFRNHTPSIGGVYGLVKLVVTVPLVLVRLVLFGLSLVVGYLTTTLASQGWKDRQSPMPRWRSRAMWITRICTRCILFSFGYQWIKRIGRPVSREIAPIVVSNHISYVEPIFFFYELFPTIVAAESHDSIPFVGTIIRAMQVIYVDRFSAASRKNAVNEIKRKASCNDFPRVLLFPEGTTTNGRSLISFQLGAFIPGLPIQPVIVRYPHVHFDQSWGNISLVKLMFRMFTQFHNFMEVEYLPIILPPESKQESVICFAELTSYAMASALNVVQTSHSYGDSMLVTRASELTRGKCSNYLVEMASVESSFGITTSTAMDLLDHFCAMNPDSNGRVKIHDFLRVYGLGCCRLFEKIFHYLDLEKKGSITFRQFLLGSAHVRRQPLFWNACETAFRECSDDRGAEDHISLNHLGDVIRSSMPHTTDESLCQLFYLFDVDGDGIIGRDDFMMCLRRNPLLIAIFTAHVG